MDKAKIIIKGEMVQDIGYKVSLLTNALSFGISNFYAYNTKIKDEQVVIVLVGAEKEIIDNFYHYIRENVPEYAVVSDFVMKDFSGNVMDIDKYLHLIQIEQLNKGIPAILDIRDNTKKMLEKQDEMLEKQDTTIHILEKVHEELGGVKEDTSDIKSTLSRMEAEEKNTKFSLSSSIDEKFQKQELEIAEIKATLARMQAAG